MNELNITESALYNEMAKICGGRETNEDAWTKEHFMALWGLEKRATDDRLKKLVVAGKLKEVWKRQPGKHTVRGYYPIKL
jgi:hypothetical protein